MSATATGIVAMSAIRWRRHAARRSIAITAIRYAGTSTKYWIRVRVARVANKKNVSWLRPDGSSIAHIAAAIAASANRYATMSDDV